MSKNKTVKLAVPATPELRAGFRDPDYVQPVVLRMGTGFVDALDEICEINGRSRRQIVEIMINRAYAEKSEPLTLPQPDLS